MSLSDPNGEGPDGDRTTGAEPALRAEPSGAVTAPRARRRLPARTRRLALILVGLLVLAGSVTGFVLAADALDERIEVVVAAVDIAPGEVIEPSHLTSTAAVPGSIPHVPWTDETAETFWGAFAAMPIEAGSLVTAASLEWANPDEDGVRLPLTVPLDLSLTAQVIEDGDLVLLIDPGVAPSAGDDGRPQRVLRQFVVENYDGQQMELHLPPDEHLQWQTEVIDAGGWLAAIPVPVGADPSGEADELDEAWQLEHDLFVAARDQEIASLTGPRPGPGQLEARIALDTSLAPSGVAQGDLVLLIDPGVEPAAGDGGRPRSVLQPLLLEHYIDGEVVVFASPEEWVAWQSLIAELGGPALVIVVPPGTDTDDMSKRLDAAWLDEWRAARSGDSGESGP